MIKSALILFITVNLIGCNIKTNLSNIPQNNSFKKKNTSYLGNYLTANYSLKKGDAYTASRILNGNLNNQKLLEIKFFSNLVSGNFVTANKVSHKLKVNGKINTIYNLPRYILKIKNNDFRGSLEIFKNQKLFFNIDDLNNLIKFWIRETENPQNYLSENYFNNSSIHKLLILENFYNSYELIKIADLIYKNNNLNSHELLLLAGFYFRAGNLEKSKDILRLKIPSHFDKANIIDDFFNKNNIFKKVQKLNVILASKIYNMTNEDNSIVNNSYSYQKILLELSVFLEPKMDISKYALAEIYTFEKTYKTAFRILETIPEKSFFSLPAN